MTTTWRVLVEYHGRLTDEQMQAIAGDVDAATFLEDGFVELRFSVTAPEPDQAVIAARQRLDQLPAVTTARQLGTLTGPHRLAVLDQLAQARQLTLAGVAEGAALMGITPARFRQLRSDDPHFPTPVLTVASAEIWDVPELLAYNTRRERGKPGRPPKTRPDA